MNEIQKIEIEIMNLSKKLAALRAENPTLEIKNYQFKTSQGDTSLLELFGQKDKLLAIHNMGQGCRYCTLWADGINGILPHLNSSMSVVLLSKDSPELQSQSALSRGWNIPMASHGGGNYIQEQSVRPGENNMPGVVLYERKDRAIFRKNQANFGPGDQFSALWHFISLAGLNEENWTPQFNYWKRPEKMDDGGNNLL